MIRILPSTVADTRTCDYTKVSKEELLGASYQHIGDVRAALVFMAEQIMQAARVHDADKITDIDSFHDDFRTGFKRTTWWDRHRKLNRHHLGHADGVRDDVNLIDVIDFICDCVMAGMGRSGTVYPLSIDPMVLRRAFDNTVELLKSQVVVDTPEPATTEGPDGVR